jgi:hypothetical protein
MSLPSSLVLAVWAALIINLPTATLGAICIGDSPVEGCGYLTFDTKPCEWVLENTQFLSGTCCSVSDMNKGKGCRITVDGPNNDCQVRLAGDFYPLMMVMSNLNNNTCPPSQYNVTMDSGGDGGGDGPIAQCKTWNATCADDDGGGKAQEECCDGLVCRRGLPAATMRGTRRCLPCKRENESCRASKDCCRGTRCRRQAPSSSGSINIKRTCRACVRLNDKPCLEDGDCCHPKARCRAKARGSAEKVCKIPAAKN